jgi:Na+/H+ antiporter NhaD/arsenite permease-like protein
MSSFLLLANAGTTASIPAAALAPFALLLLLIAVIPLTPRGIRHFWESYYPHFSVGLGASVAAWFFFGVEGGAATVGHTALEYLSFISLIGSLFVVAGGIHLRVRGEATPWENARFLLLGALAANLIGTTGASMVLIRPWIRMNKVRMSAYHVVFFIFVVSNCGGALTPVGDPPLFIGYLRGVSFFWLLGHAWLPWLFVVAALVGVFAVIDFRSFRKAAPIIQAESEEPDTFRVEGRWNFLFLAVIVGAVFIPGSLPLLREAVMLAAAALSYRLTPRPVHDANAFSFVPIKEVAFLFIGIFLTMMPALGYVAERGREFGVEKPMQYYVAAGSLSAVLDNAPTYATFFELALASTLDAGAGPEAASVTVPSRAGLFASTRALLDAAPGLVIAVSLGAVFFGAMTYIGNGPNFMVKAIADSVGVKTPRFFDYILRFSLPILLPILLLAGWIFL